MKQTLKVRDLVISDYRMADVFAKWGIRYCCGGNVSLEEACAARQIDLAEVEKDLQQAAQTISLPPATAFHAWPLPFLTEYIFYVHHGYVKQVLPGLRQLLASFVPGHQKKYPHLASVHETFLHLAEELEEQMARQEESIFPYVKQLSNTYSQKEKYGRLFVRTLRKPLDTTIEVEHGRLVSLLKQLRSQTGHYTFGPEACPHYQVIYQKLKEFDSNLVQHKYLENNILFPQALEMEKSLLQL